MYNNSYIYLSSSTLEVLKRRLLVVSVFSAQVLKWRMKSLATEKTLQRPLSYSSDEDELPTPWVTLLRSWVWDGAHGAVVWTEWWPGLVWQRQGCPAELWKWTGSKRTSLRERWRQRRRGSNEGKWCPKLLGTCLVRWNLHSPIYGHNPPTHTHTDISVLLQVNSTTKCPGWCCHRSLTKQWFAQTARW